MKTTSQATVFIAILLLGLGCESPNTVVDKRFPDPAVIVGKIINWTWADSMTIQASVIPRPSLIPDVIASGRVNPDGSFSMTLPDPPLAAQLGWGFAHSTVSDTSAQFVLLFDLGLSGPSRSATHSVRNANMDRSPFNTPGYFTVLMVFANRAVLVSGADTIIHRKALAPQMTHSHSSRHCNAPKDGIVLWHSKFKNENTCLLSRGNLRTYGARTGTSINSCNLTSGSS